MSDDIVARADRLGETLAEVVEGAGHTRWLVRALLALLALLALTNVAMFAHFSSDNQRLHDLDVETRRLAYQTCLEFNALKAAAKVLWEERFAEYPPDPARLAHDRDLLDTAYGPSVCTP